MMFNKAPIGNILNTPDARDVRDLFTFLTPLYSKNFSHLVTSSLISQSLRC